MRAVSTCLASCATCAAALLVAIVVSIPGAAAAGQAGADATFMRDVLPILQRTCQRCHRPGAGAPMSLLTYSLWVSILSIQAPT